MALGNAPILLHDIFHLIEDKCDTGFVRNNSDFVCLFNLQNEHELAYYVNLKLDVTVWSADVSIFDFVCFRFVYISFT